jgi:aminoglycoside phosphotransferase family enzyme/predicted kinase
MLATPRAVDEPWVVAGNLAAEVRETHTGIVVLLGSRAYKAKKSLVTDFLDFSTPDRREQACAHEVALNRRLAPDSYLGVGHFSAPDGGSPEPVVVMRRYPDSARLATLVKTNEPVRHHLCVIAQELVRFHERAARSRAIDDQGRIDAVSTRWQQNLEELERYAGAVIPIESIREIGRRATRFVSGRGALFAQRISERRVVDGHADLLADDIFCLPQGPALLDCLEFDDHLRYVDGIDDAAFLAMDLEFLGREDLGDHFLDEYTRRADDPAPRALQDFYIAYRAVVRAKVDCVRVGQGHQQAAADAHRHLDIALEHLRAGTVSLIIIGGGPGTGKTTLAHALAERFRAQVISTDYVRRQLQRDGTITGRVGELDAGLYAPENVARVYEEVLRRARSLLTGGESVILDGTWRDARQRDRAHQLATETASAMVQFTCAVSSEDASARIRERSATDSDATPEIAAALAEGDGTPREGYSIDTRRPLADTVAEAEEIYRRAT